MKKNEEKNKMGRRALLEESCMIQICRYKMLGLKLAGIVISFTACSFSLFFFLVIRAAKQQTRVFPPSLLPAGHLREKK